MCGADNDRSPRGGKGLARLDGRIASIRGPEAGTVELASCGLLAFFVPAQAGASKGKDETGYRAEFIEMKDIGHFPMSENYPVFKQYLEQALQKIESRLDTRVA